MGCRAGGRRRRNTSLWSLKYRSLPCGQMYKYSNKHLIILLSSKFTWKVYIYIFKKLLLHVNRNISILRTKCPRDLLRALYFAQVLYNLLGSNLLFCIKTT